MLDRDVDGCVVMSVDGIGGAVARCPATAYTSLAHSLTELQLLLLQQQ